MQVSSLKNPMISYHTMFPRTPFPSVQIRTNPFKSAKHNPKKGA